jgi:prefoldin beta subunit
MSVELPEKVQSLLAQAQQIQQQYQIIASQRQQHSALLSEIKETAEYVSKLKKGATVYKTIGSLMVKVTDLKSLGKELDEKKETLGVKVKSLERQEKNMRERFESIQKEVSTLMGGAKGS